MDRPLETFTYDICLPSSVLLPENGPTAAAELFYLFDAGDPFAVDLLIRDETGFRSLWSVSREVLIQCAIHGVTAGSGDFVIEVNTKHPIHYQRRPDVPVGDTLLMHFTSDGGEHAHGFVHRAGMRIFLQQTLKRCPEGQESKAYDWDKLLR